MTRLKQRIMLALLGLATSTVCAQFATPVSHADGEWQFARLVYRDTGRGGTSFRTDWPEAEVYLKQGLERLTRLDIGTDTWIELDDFDLMNYPWLYAVEPGHWVLSEQDAEVLREYLMRGGFLLLDDFWGENEWRTFETSMRRVFPSHPIIEIPDTDPLMSLIYDVDKSIQIPGANFGRGGVTWQNGGRIPHWRGIYDDDGRLMVAINFNMDLGDAWEHADDPYYPQEMTTLAMRYAVNYVIYSMTH